MKRFARTAAILNSTLRIFDADRPATPTGAVVSIPEGRYRMFTADDAAFCDAYHDCPDSVVWLKIDGHRVGLMPIEAPARPTLRLMPGA